MKILWLVNIVLPEAAEAFGLARPVLGGWLHDTSRHLAECGEVSLSVAACYPGRELKCAEVGGIQYWLVPAGKPESPALIRYYRQICEKFHPDLIHIHGTEHQEGLSCIAAAPDIPHVISIQGLTSVHCNYCLAGLTWREMLGSITLRDVLRRDFLWSAHFRWHKLAHYDSTYFQNCSDCIGRTTWDRDHALKLNPEIAYHFCNESLRNAFYNASGWNRGKCRPHTIFLSQAGTPLKGLHQVIRAAGLLLRDFPDLQIRIAGPDILRTGSFAERLKQSGYGKFIRKLLQKEKLGNQVLFLGPLNVDRMIEEYQGAHLFICPSSIENSPNSLGEAQMIGTPSIGSYVGGVPDMVENGKTGLLYRFEEYEMLASAVRRVFNDDAFAQNLSEHGRKAALTRHDRKRNLTALVDIYRTVLAKNGINCSERGS